MASAIHHLHKRKRVHEKHEKYPHPNKWKNLLDKLIYVVAIVGPLSAIPQIVKLWVHKTAEGVAIIPWVAFLIGAVFMAIYGFMHKERPLIIMYISWIAVHITIIVGIIVYR